MLVNFLQNAVSVHARQTTPSGVYGGHLLASRIAQQDGEAVRHHHRAGQTRCAGKTGIGLLAIGRVCAQFKHPGSVHLVHKHGPHTHGILQAGAVLQHVFGQVAHMGSQVKAVVGRARHATRPCGA